MNSRRLARLRYEYKGNDQQIITDGATEITRFFQEGRIPVQLRKLVLAIVWADLNDKEEERRLVSWAEEFEEEVLDGDIR